MRRFDLDWLRISAFALLIVHHAGMLYVPWDFHVKSDYRGGPALLAPLLFGMAVVVVPQLYFEVSQAGRYRGDFVAFWGRYLRLDQSFGTPVPTWNHLWFVAYLLIYSLTVAALAPKPSGSALSARAEPSRTAVVALLFAPWVWLWLLRTTLFPRFGSTHAMADDGYNHALYFSMFLFGYSLVGRPLLGLAIDRLRWPALALALTGGAVYVALSLGAGEALPPGEWRLGVGRAGREALAWGAVLAALGFGQRHLNHDHRWRAYLAEAVFAYYIVHQTALIALSVWLEPLQLGGPLEAALVIAGTLMACVASAELARRTRWLRPLFGFSARPSRG